MWFNIMVRKFLVKMIWLMLCLSLLVNLAACIGAPQVVLTPSETESRGQLTGNGQTSAAAPLPTATLTPLPTSTSTSTATQTPTVTPTATITPYPEPEGCRRPPDDYTRVVVNGWTINARTLAMLEHTAEFYSGVIDVTGYAITQGSYNPGVSASFGTHDGGGVVDISVIRRERWEILWDDIEPLIKALRTAGFAAWLRMNDELYPGSPIHIHAVAIGDKDLSTAAVEQLTGPHGYFRGFNGLPDIGPVADGYGGPVLCRWMIDMGYADFRVLETETNSSP
jgi:hypothetical protein